MLFDWLKKHSSCCFLEYRGIHFVPHATVRPCCPLGDYSYELFSALNLPVAFDGVFDVEKYIDHINEVKKVNRSEDPLCKRCGYFEKKRCKKRGKFLINHHLILSHYGLCNFNCDYCTLTEEAHREKPEDILPVLNDMMARKLISPKALVEFSGGEPALLPTIPEILSLFKANGNPVVFYTNASIFSLDIYDYLKNSNASHLITSLDCGTKEGFHQKRGRDAFDKVLKNIEKYSEIKNGDGKSKAVLKYIFSQNNLAENEIDGFIEIVEKYRPFKVLLTMDFLTISKDIEDVYERVSQLALSVKDRLLRKGIAVEFSSYDTETRKMYYPKGQSGEKRLFRTYLPGS